MKTRKPISTISFNSEPFLSGTLERLLKNGIIQFYAYIYHIGEDDEGGKKDHMHVYIEPNGNVDTAELEKTFIEPVTNHSKPLKCLNFKNSKVEDWYLYGLHHPPYLMKKGLVKAYHYKAEDVQTSDEDELRVRTHGLLANSGAYTLYTVIDNAMTQGLTPPEILAAGIVAPQMLPYANAYMSAKLQYLSSLKDEEMSIDDKIQAYSDGTALLNELEREIKD